MKPRIKRILIITTGVALVLVIAFLTSRFLNQRAMDRVLPAFKAAQVIEPIPQQNPGPTVTNRWNQVVQPAGGAPITIEALSFFGNATVRYADESTPRVVAPSEDYIWPQELRLGPGSRVLYVRTSGLGGGVFPTTKLYEFDLVKRTLITKVTIN